MDFYLNPDKTILRSQCPKVKVLLRDTTAENSLQRAAHKQKDNCMQHTDNGWFAVFCPYMSAEMSPPTSPPHNQIPFHSIPKSIFQHSNLLLYSYCSFLSSSHSEVFSCRYIKKKVLIKREVCGGIGVAFSKGNILRQNKVSLSVRYRERYSCINACGWSDVPSPSANEPFWVKLYF